MGLGLLELTTKKYFNNKACVLCMYLNMFYLNGLSENVVLERQHFFTFSKEEDERNTIHYSNIRICQHI